MPAMMSPANTVPSVGLRFRHPSSAKTLGERRRPRLLSGETTLEALHLQWFTVLFYCRVLQSLATSRLPSKPEAMRWALVELGPRWAPLIEDAWRRRAEYPWGRGAPGAHAALHPSGEAAAETLAFVRLALDRMGSAAKGA